MSPLRGEKPQNWVVSKNNTAAELPEADPAGKNENLNRNVNFVGCYL